MKPNVLLISTTRWISPAHLAMALVKAGCTVQAICCAAHPLGAVEVVQRIYPYHWLTPLPCLLRAIRAVNPDLLIPTDDVATKHLHDIYAQEKQAGKSAESTCALIERSLGASVNFPFLFERTTVLDLAREEGVRVPEIRVVDDVSDLAEWVSQHGFPMVLKANGTTGGVGVRVVRNLKEAEEAFVGLQVPTLALAAKRALLAKDWTFVWPSIVGKRFVVNAQVFVAGREATSVIACHKGQVLSSLQFEVIQDQYAAGPATVLRIVDNTDMSLAAERLAGRLQLSGLHGLDFILDKETDQAYLLELNPRATQVGHLAMGPGRDLPAAVVASITGESIQPSPKVTEKDTISLFPQEWRRDPASPHLRSSFHDVPWEEPGLIHLCMAESLKKDSWSSPKKWAAMIGLRS